MKIKKNSFLFVPVRFSVVLRGLFGALYSLVSHADGKTYGGETQLIMFRKMPPLRNMLTYSQTTTYRMLFLL